MGIHYENLDDVTRPYMVEEVDLGNHYESPRLTAEGLQRWAGLLREAAQSHDDDWLAAQILDQGLMKRHEQSTSSKGNPYTRRIPQPHAAQQLAEGEFNRFYLRGLCRRAQDEGITHLVVYRGKEVDRPRPESQAKIGQLIPVDQLLQVLRTNDFVAIEESALIPGGPNSGLTARLP